MFVKTYVVRGMGSPKDADHVRKALLAVPDVVSCEVDYRSGLCEVGMTSEVATDVLNRALSVLDGEYSLVVAGSFADTGGSFFQGFAWVPIAVVGAVLVGMLVWLLWFEFFG